LWEQKVRRKSQLAVVLCYKAHGEKSSTGLFYVCVEGGEKKSLITMANKVPERESDRKENTKAYGRLVELSRLKRARC
jgi:hypothetical protein